MTEPTVRESAKTEPAGTGTPKRARRRWGRFFLLVAGGVLLALSVAGGWYMTTDRFHRWLHSRVVTALQDATGGRVELGGFHMIPFRLQMEGRDLTVHGTEKAGSIPFGHADAVVVEVQLLPLLGGQVALNRLTLEHPVVWVEFAADGTSNIPAPKGPADPRPAPEQLFDMSIGRLEVHSGELIWNDQSIPVDFVASGVSGGMSHSLFRRRYEGKVHLDKVDTRLQDYRPFSWSGDLEFGLTRRRLDIKSLSLTSGRSRLNFAGDVQDFVHPEWFEQYHKKGTVKMDHMDAVDAPFTLAPGGYTEVFSKGHWHSLTGPKAKPKTQRHRLLVRMSVARKNIVKSA